MVEHLLFVLWVSGSVPYGGPFELFLVPVSAPHLLYVLSCLWDVNIKKSVAANWKESPMK